MRKLAAAALALALLSCRTGGIRPRYAPVPHSIMMLLPDSAKNVVVTLADRSVAMGFTVARYAPNEGYLETGWYDTKTKRPVGDPFNDLDRIVKLRFFADPWQGRTRLVAESVRRIAWDPSEPQHDLERMVPDDHPGRALLDSVLAVVRPPDTTTTQPDTTRANARPDTARGNATRPDTTRRDTTRVLPRPSPARP